MNELAAVGAVLAVQREVPVTDTENRVDVQPEAPGERGGTRRRRLSAGAAAANGGPPRRKARVGGAQALMEEDPSPPPHAVPALQARSAALSTDRVSLQWSSDVSTTIAAVKRSYMLSLPDLRLETNLDMWRQSAFTASVRAFAATRDGRGQLEEMCGLRACRCLFASSVTAWHLARCPMKVIRLRVYDLFSFSMARFES